MKLDPIVKRETGYMALGCLVGTAVTALVFVLLGRFDMSVALGCLIGYVMTVGNFFWMSCALSLALEEEDEVATQLKMKRSYVLRSVIMLVVMGASIVLDGIHWVPVVAAVFYPRIIIFLRGIVQSIKDRNAPTPPPAPITEEEEDDEDEFERFVGGFARTKKQGSTAKRVSEDENSSTEGR